MRKLSPIIIAISLLSIVAGILHGVIASYQHMSVLPEFAFFISMGLLQILRGIRFAKQQNNQGFRSGVALHGGLLVLWLLVRVVQAPFQSGPEHFGLMDSIIGGIEVILLICLGFWRDETTHEHITRKYIILHIKGLSLFKGLLFYGVAMAMVPLFPAYIGASHHHGTPKSHGHTMDMKDGHHEKDNKKEPMKQDMQDDLGNDTPTIVEDDVSDNSLPKVSDKEPEVDIKDDDHGHDDNEDDDHGHD